MTWTPPDDRFLNTFGVCRPCHDHNAVWAMYHDQWGIPWEQDSLGMYTEIGKINKRPIVVSVFWANIADRRIAFIEPTSALVDYDMVDQWCSTVFPNAVSFTNEANFHNIVRAIEDALNVKSLMARNHVFGLYAKHAPANPSYMLQAKDIAPTTGIGEPFKRITYKDLPKDPTNGGWRKKLLTMDWHEISLDGYPGWESESVERNQDTAVRQAHAHTTGQESRVVHARDEVGRHRRRTILHARLDRRWDPLRQQGRDVLVGLVVQDRRRT